MPSSVLDAMQSIASDLGVSLERKLCWTSYGQNDRLQIVVTISTVPETEEARSLMQSSFMCAVLETFPDAACQVHALPPMRPPTTVDIGSWFDSQVTCLNDWAVEAVVILMNATFRRVIDAYPWRERASMLTLLPVLVQHVKSQAPLGLPVAKLMGVADLILPPLRCIVTEQEGIEVVQDAIRFKGRCPKSLFEAYESLHQMVTQDKPRSPATDDAFRKLFVA
jgi:hypothetical protein